MGGGGWKSDEGELRNGRSGISRLPRVCVRALVFVCRPCTHAHTRLCVTLCGTVPKHSLRSFTSREEKISPFPSPSSDASRIPMPTSIEFSFRTHSRFGCRTFYFDLSSSQLPSTCIFSFFFFTYFPATFFAPRSPSLAFSVKIPHACSSELYAVTM